MRRLKGVYLIPNSQNYKKKEREAESGSSSHIQIGINHLASHFEMQTYILSAMIPQQTTNGHLNKKVAAVGRKVDENKFRGLLRDVKYLIKNHLHFFKHYRAIKKSNVDFIYERSEYLNLNGIIIAKILGLPHFYESNWIHHLGMRQFYLSYFNGIVKRIEESMYNISNHSFFIGNQNKYLGLKDGKWSVVQNGVGLDIIEKYKEHENRIGGQKVEFCVLANLMPHHRFDILSSALSKLDARYKSLFRLHLVGFNFQHVLSEIPTDIEYVHHGPKTKSEVYPLLADMNVAIISGGPHYSSFMKLYEYAAAKLAVICPKLENITANFSDEEILFFENEDATSLSAKVEFILDNTNSVAVYGNALYNRVRDNFTWEHIFQNISDKIAKHAIENN
jgi:glycosyltransferase involved in cell wall biosynthesis